MKKVNRFRRKIWWFVSACFLCVMVLALFIMPCWAEKEASSAAKTDVGTTTTKQGDDGSRDGTKTNEAPGEEKGDRKGEEKTESSAETTVHPAEPVSPALNVLAAGTDMSVATLTGNDYYFSRDIFARALNLSSVKSITVASLPGTTDGELLMGSDRVEVGQEIAGSHLQLLSFVAADSDVSQASFRFYPNGAGYAVTCHVYVLDKVNYSPTVSVAGEGALTVSTHRDFVGYGKLSAYDPEGDPLTYEVVRAPAHGLVLMTDSALGEYVYLPRTGYTGTDSFCYVARDRYGNYSASAQVSVRVDAPSVTVEYADMKGRPEYNAALTMTECGLMKGTELNQKTYFYPDQTVSRAEFLTMAMRAVGVEKVPSVTDTGFADDSEIAADDKGFVAAAYSMGYIKGSTNEKGELCFLPDQTITRAEAAVILRRMVDAKTPALSPAFADASDIPAWASEAVTTLSSMGILTTSGGAVSPNSQVTRAGAAVMLSALRRQSKK